MWVWVGSWGVGRSGVVVRGGGENSLRLQADGEDIDHVQTGSNVNLII